MTVAQFFDTEAARYDAAFDDPGPEGNALRARLAATISVLGNGPGRVLDAGMGPGRLCVELQRRGWTVIGLDVSEKMVKFARARIGQPGSVLCGRVERLPFSEGYFDAVVATGVLEYLPDVTTGIRELVRVLRPGGLAALSYPNAYALNGLWQQRVWYPLARRTKVNLRRRAARPDTPTPRSPHSIRAHFTACGLTVTSEHYVVLRDSLRPFDLLAPRLAVRLPTRLAEAAPFLERVLAVQIVFAGEKR